MEDGVDDGEDAFQQTKQKTQTLMAMELAIMRMMTMTTMVGQQHKKPNAAELLT